MDSSHLKSELVAGLTYDKIGDLYIQSLREFELISKSHLSVT